MRKLWMRLPLVMMGMLALLGAMWGGLARLGWELPPAMPALVTAHGPLMVAGFLGTVISLERAVALERRWAYMAPAASGLGALALISGAPWPAGALLMTWGSMVLGAVFVTLLRRQRTVHMGTMGAGAASLFVGNLLWAAGWTVAQAVPWWMAFVVLTIAGERLELARVRRLSRTGTAWFIAAGGTLVAGVLATALWYDTGARVAGAGMIGLALWLLRHDLALRLHSPGPDPLRRFMERALTLGYGWLALGGAFLALYGGVTAGPRYDAVLHAVFLGFTFTMIFAHAPIILPAVLGTPVAFRTFSYLPLLLLQGSLLVRLAGDLTTLTGLRQWGGLVNTAAVLAFLAGAVFTAATAASSQRRTRTGPVAGSRRSKRMA